MAKLSRFRCCFHVGKFATNIYINLRLTEMSQPAHGTKTAGSVLRFGWHSVLLLLVLAPSLPAQLPVTRLGHLFPPGGKAGTSVEVTVIGSDLDEPTRIYFSHSGISSKLLHDGAKFTVTIASNVAPGVYEARFVGRFGISNPRAFIVGYLPEAIAPSTNSTTASAMELNLNSTIYGRVQPNTVGWFRFSAKKGQRLFIECLAESLDSRMDAMLVLSAEGGHELERARTGGLIDFTPQTDGTYLLKVADFLYRGGDDYFFRLTLTSGPRIDFALPAAGLPGTKTNIALYGRNLPGGKPANGFASDGKALEQLNVEVVFPGDQRKRYLDTGLIMRPSNAGVDGFEYRLKTPKGIANPILLGFATAPVVLEREPNNEPDQAQKIRPPCEINGQFFSAREQDWFTFEAKKGDAYWIEVLSQRLGLPTDPFVLVQRVTKNDKGEEQTSDVLELADSDTNLGDREFNTSSRDPAGRFEAKEDGTYRLVVRDLFQRAERSPRFIYRLSIRPESPDFRLVAQSLAPKLKADAKNIDIGIPLLRRGETLPVRVMAFRRDGFNGDIMLSIENPPPGLVFDGDVIASGKNSTVILLSATEDAPAFVGPLQLVGQAQIGDKELSRPARAGTMVFPVANYDTQRPESRLAQEFMFAISEQESAPVTIAAAEKKIWEAAANGKLEIPLKIKRDEEFNAALKLKPVGPGEAKELKEFEVAAKATNAMFTLDFAALKLAAGNYVFSLQTQTTGKYRINPEAAELAEAAAKEADKNASELVTAATTAKESLEKATKAVQDAEAAAKSAAEKLATAKAATANAGAEESLKSTLASAEAAANEAAAATKSATKARTAAEQALKTAEAKAAEAKAGKESTAFQAKKATDRAKPKDTSILVYSAPIQVRVTAAEQAKTDQGKAEQAKSK